MNKNHAFLKNFIFLTLCTLLLAAAASPLAEARTLRVGYYMFDGYQMEDSQHIRSGYGYDFLQELARYGGWDYEYVGYNLGWAKLQEMLDHGEIDILTSARRTPARESQYLFSTEMGTSAGILTVKSGSTRLTMGDYTSYNGIRVGMIRDSSINENFQRFAADKGFNYTPVYFLNADEMNTALQNEDGIDAVCTTNLRRTKNEWIIDQFDADYFYVMLRRDNAALQQEINDAVAQMDFYTPGWRTTFRNKYYKPDVGSQISLTAEEKEFIAWLKSSDQTFTVITEPDNAPYSYFENGAAMGIIPDIFAEISRRTGIEFHMLAPADRTAYNKALQNGEADIRLDACFNYDQAEKTGFQLTIPYLTTPISQLRRKGDDSTPQRIALLLDSDNIIASYRDLFHPGIEKQWYPSIQSCVEVLLNGSADVVYLYPYTAEKYLETENGSRLSATLLPHHTVSLAIAVSRRLDNRMLTILNKAVASVNESYTNQVILSHVTTKSPDISFTGFFAQHPYAKTGLIILIITLLSTILISLNRQRSLRPIQEKNLQLHEAMQLATEANKAKSTFLSSMSHDMRTPLNGIIGFTNFAITETDFEKKQLYLKKVQQASHILLDLIDNTLEVSRIESGKFQLEPENIVLHELTDSILAVIQADAERKNITFGAAIDCPDHTCLFADRIKLQELFLNLLSNAVKYTPAGGSVKLTVRQLLPPKDGKNLEIIIADTGIGMSREFIPHMYEAFAQERNELLQHTTGSGLGLAIVRRIVDLMQGTISLQSEPGKGSTFTVLLPVEICHTLPRDINAPACTKEDFSGQKVLLCEDNELNTEIACTLLERRGLRVVTAENGQQGAAIFAASAPNEFAVILMDIHMPVMDGYAATAAIRQSPHPSAQSIPIIAMTADAYDEDIKKCLAAGMNGHLAKPIDPSRLFQTLAKYIT